MDYKREHQWRIKMSNDPDLCYWDGQAINAMTREALQKALGDALMIIEIKNHTINFHFLFFFV